METEKSNVETKSHAKVSVNIQLFIEIMAVANVETNGN